MDSRKIVRKMIKKVMLYTDNGNASAIARRHLTEQGIVFKEINVTEEGIGIAKRRLPFLEVRKSSGVSTVEGFGGFQYAQALDSTLSYDVWVKRKNEQS